MVRSGVKIRFGPHCTPPPPHFDPPILENKCYHTNKPNRVWSETQASGVVRSGVKNRFGPHCPPTILTPTILENKSYPGIATCLIPSTRHHLAQQGLIRNSSLWGGKIGGQKPVWTSLHLPPPFWPPNSREQELSRYSHLSDSIHWGSLDIIKRVRPETQAHDLRDMLLLKSMYFRFNSVYSIGIPLFLENKSYPGIPTPRSWKSVTIPTIPTGSGQKLKPLGW